MQKAGPAFVTPLPSGALTQMSPPEVHVCVLGDPLHYVKLSALPQGSQAQAALSCGPGP